MNAPQNASPLSLALVLFWTGVFLLVWLLGAIRTVHHLVRQYRRARIAIEETLERRREHLRGLLRLLQDAPESAELTEPSLTSLTEAISKVVQVPEGLGTFAAEQEVSRLLHTLFASPDGAQWDMDEAWANREQQIAFLRERYNEAARALMGVRASFPLGLVARALIAQDPPLFR